MTSDIAQFFLSSDFPKRRPFDVARSLARSFNAVIATNRFPSPIATSGYHSTLNPSPVCENICLPYGRFFRFFNYFEILREMNVGDSESAARMMPVGLSGAQRIVVARLMKSPQPKSQAELSRELGRSRATIHSAIKVLRRRGIVHSHELKLAPHLEGLQTSGVEYEWLDERPLPE